MSKIEKNLDNIKGFVLDVDGVLSATTLQIGDDGQPIRTTNLKDGFAIRAALEAGYRFAIISGGKTEAVRKRYNLLGVNDVYIGITKKLPVFEEWLKANGLSAEDVAYMGDDLPDLPCLRRAGLSAAPYDAAREVIETADFISKFTGGYGCVRDLIESVMRAQSRWPEEIQLSYAKVEV